MYLKPLCLCVFVCLGMQIGLRVEGRGGGGAQAECKISVQMWWHIKTPGGLHPSLKVWTQAAAGCKNNNLSHIFHIHPLSYSFQ